MDPCAPSDLVRAIAPTGTLRVAINYGNVVLAQTGPDGAPAGVTADLARELGRRLAVPVRFTTYDTAGKVVEALGGDRPWDMAFLAIDPLRAETIAFSPALRDHRGGVHGPRDLDHRVQRRRRPGRHPHRGRP